MYSLLGQCIAWCYVLFCVLGQTPLNTTHTTSFVVFPQDCNANPPMLFGGKLLAEMDRCAGITTRRLLYSSPTGAKDAVTRSIDNVVFYKPAQVKDLIIVTGNVESVGEKSITVHVTVIKETANQKELIVEGKFTFVAYNLAEMKSMPHGIILGKSGK